MRSHLHFWQVALLVCSVNAALPSPQNVTMNAINTRYILWWDWNHTQPYDVTFTAESTFSHLEEDESSYTKWCTFNHSKRCDFSAQLAYTGAYVLRVRAEGQGEHSNWTKVKFCPEDDADLGPPSHVKVELDIAMVTISFREPVTEQRTPMSSILKPMSFRLKYWGTQTPNQKLTKVIQTTQCSLPLQPQTEVCLQVSAFSEEYGKISPYTQPLCVTTLGHPPVWQMLLAVICVVLLMGLIFTIYRKRRNLIPYHPKPSSLLGFPITRAPLLMNPVEECFPVMPVLTKTTELATTGWL